MASPQFSKPELRKLHVAWLAWNNLQTREFLRDFKPIWDSIMGEVSVLFQKSNFSQNVCEIGKAGFTLNPDVGFAFSPIVEAYQINVWSLLFCRQELDVFFNPSFLIAGNLVHEHSHFNFWKQHNVLGKDRQIKERFASSHGLEDEKYALTEELKFLSQLIDVVSPSSDIILFHVKSWNIFGQPVCEGISAEFPNKENILQRINMIESTLKQILSQKDYSVEMVESSRKIHSELSAILKLDLKENYAIVPMEI